MTCTLSVLGNNQMVVVVSVIFAMVRVVKGCVDVNSVSVAVFEAFFGGAMDADFVRVIVEVLNDVVVGVDVVEIIVVCVKLVVSVVFVMVESVAIFACDVGCSFCRHKKGRGLGTLQHESFALSGQLLGRAARHLWMSADVAFFSPIEMVVF